MTGLEETFGEDFVQDYKKTIAEKREERTNVSEESLREIAHLAINEGKLQDGEPQFQYVTDSDVTHDVFLMQLPQMDGRSIFSYANELDSGAVTCPLDYLGEWWSCLFNDPEDLKNMEEGEHYIVVGQYDTWVNDKGEENEQVSPVRGVMHHAEAKKYADEHLSGDVNDNPPEEETEQGPDHDEEDTSSDEDESDDGGFSGFGGEEDDEEDEEEEDTIVYEDVKSTVQELADKDEQVWEVERSDDRLEKLSKVVCDRCDYDFNEYGQDVGETCLEVIDEHNSEDEDDEEELMFG